MKCITESVEDMRSRFKRMVPVQFGWVSASQTTI